METAKWNYCILLICVILPLASNFKRDTNSLAYLANIICRSVENMEIERMAGIKYADEGYKHRTITLAAGIRKGGEPIELLMYNVDRLLALKDEKGRNSAYMRK